MPSRNNLGLFVIVSALTTLMCAGPLLAAPVPARYLRLSFGRTAYWLFTIASVTGLLFLSPSWALSQFILLLLIGLFTDLEQNRVPIFYSGAVSVFFAGISLFFLIGTWARAQQTTLPAFLKNHIQLSLTEVSQKFTQMPNFWTPEKMMALFPVIVAITLMMLVCIGLLFVKPQSKTEKISAFYAPDFMIWVFILALAGSFFISPTKSFYIQNTAFNLLFFCGAIYYFQGLAVAGFFLQRMKVNYFLKTGLFIILAVQLLPFTTVLGLSDVWFSYRSKWYKKLLKDNPRRDV